MRVLGYSLLILKYTEYGALFCNMQGWALVGWVIYVAALPTWAKK